MHVSRLRLRDFRNYERADLTLSTGAHLFLGANGQGKTNLVEAIGYLSTLSSHRVSSDAALVRAGAESALVQGELAHGSRRLDIEVRIQRSGSNRARVGARQIRTRELSRYITTVLFAPEDLALVRGDPSRRREYFDRLLVTHAPRLGGVIAEYERVVRQRNSLLRHARGTRSAADMPSSLEVWDERLLALGTEIIAERAALAARMTPHVREGYARIAGQDHDATIHLRITALEDEASREEAVVPGGSIEFDELREQFAARLHALREQEIERGQSLVGPHRDDAVLMLNGLPARTTASHGESWSYALALKLAAAELVRADSLAGDPVLILDDVFSELDGTRRERLGAAIEDVEQVLMTAAVLNDVPESLRGSITRIERGSIQAPGEKLSNGGARA